MSTSCGVQLVQLLRHSQAHVDDLLANAPGQVQADRPSGVPGRIGLGCDLRADVLQPGLAEQFRDAAADPRVCSTATTGVSYDRPVFRPT